MKELEDVNCEIRRVIDLHLSISDRLDHSANGSHKSPKLPTGNEPRCHRGGFLTDALYAWLSYDSHLAILNAKTGENISSWTFSENITSVAQFPTLPGQLPLLLVGLDNGANKIKDSAGLLCIYDCSTSRVLRAIKMPAGVEQTCIVSGGTEWEEFNNRPPDNVLSETSGIACVALRNLYHLLIDLRRPLWDTPNPYSVLDESSPAVLEFSPNLNSNENLNSLGVQKHMAFNMMTDHIEKLIDFNREEFEQSVLFEESFTTAVLGSTKIGCLISGCYGRIIIWQNNGSIEWISPPTDDCLTITHFALLEPTDDPRPFCYLFVGYQDEFSNNPPLLRMYTLLFQQKYYEKGTNLYFNLESEPSLKFEYEFDEADKIISLSAIEREINCEQTDTYRKKSENNLLLIAANNKTVLFDLNQWYKEHMPHTIEECQNPNSIIANYRTRIDVQSAMENQILSCRYLPGSLRELPTHSPNPPEELFFPNSLSFEWIEISMTQIIFWTTRGIQGDLLQKMLKTGPIILIHPNETYQKCISVGLVPFNSESPSRIDENQSREMLLSLCLEQHWTKFLIKCAKEWSDGSASYSYPTFLNWAIQRAKSLKKIADRICVPLFDQSGNNIGEFQMRTLRFCSQQLECLYNVFAELPLESNDSLIQYATLKRISTYLQVLLWFYDVGLLPESQDLDDQTLPVSLSLKIPYPVEKLSSMYKEKREQIQTNEEVFFIDELITRECPKLRRQWEAESTDINSNGYYPPPSLQTLLRSYLEDCEKVDSNEIECKHQITIYLLMDLAMLLQGSYPSVDQLIKYPSAFKMSAGLIKLTQAFWLLDHEDYPGFLELMTGQFISEFDVKDWHHKLVVKILLRNNQHKLALMYLQVRKPPLTNIQDQGTIIKLAVEHNLVQSAFHNRPPSHYAQLLINFFEACAAHNKLTDILHLALDPEEERIFIEFLETRRLSDIKLVYYLQRCQYIEAGSKCIYGQSKNNLKSASIGMYNAYTATLPEITKQFSLNVQGRKLNNSGIECKYPKPMSHRQSCSKTDIYAIAISKARETYGKGENNYLPFVSAPCTALKVNTNVDTSCVVFPTLLKRSPRKKRTADFDEDNENSHVRMKRRKLLDEKDILSETPLVKRKCQSLNNDATSETTPHSILKIRQLIRDSTSPCISQSIEDNLSRKSCRQIRFSIEPNKQLYDTTVLSNNSSTNIIRLEPSDSLKSTSSNVSSNDDTNFSGKDIFPRPRPSLRRTSQMKPICHSPILSDNSSTTIGFAPGIGNESSSSTKSTIEEIDNETGIFSKSFVNSLKPRRSSLNPISYDTAILSDDSSNIDAFDDDNLSKDDKQSFINCNRVPVTASTPLMLKDVKGEKIDDEEEDVFESFSKSNETVVHEDDITEDESEDEHFSLILTDDEKCVTKDSSNSGTWKEGVGEDLTRTRSQSSKSIQETVQDSSIFERGENITTREESSESIEEELTDDENIQRRSTRSLKSIQETQNKDTRIRKESSASIEEDDENSSKSPQKMMEEQIDSKNRRIREESSASIENLTDDENLSSNVQTRSRRSKSLQEPPKVDSSKNRRIRKESSASIEEDDENSSKSSQKMIEKDKDSKNTRTRKESIEEGGEDDTSERKEKRKDSKNRRTRKESSASMEERGEDVTKEKELKNWRFRKGTSESIEEDSMKPTTVTSRGKASTKLIVSKDPESRESNTSKTRKNKKPSVDENKFEDSTRTELDSPETRTLRRSKRRAVSVQKELIEPRKPLASKTRTRSSSTSMLNEKIDSPIIDNKSNRNKNKQLIEDVDTPIEDEINVRVTRRRCTSVPKDVVPVMEKEVKICKRKVVNSMKESGKKTKKDDVVGKSSSIQSIPEELEQVLSLPSKKRSVKNDKQRRAVSEEPISIQTRTRSRLKKIVEEVIVEESSDVEEDVHLKSKATKTTRKRKTSTSSNDNGNNRFKFSQPDRVDGRDMDGEVIGQVPSFVFSPPHTRSRNQRMQK